MQPEEPCAGSAPSGPDVPERRQRSPDPEPRLSGQLLPELYSFVARVLFYLAPVYLAGYLGLSVTWLLLGALLWMWWRRNRRGKLGRLEAAFEFLEHEREFISRELRGQHLPAWVSRAGRRAVGFRGGAGAHSRASRKGQGSEKSRGRDTPRIKTGRPGLRKVARIGNRGRFFHPPVDLRTSEGRDTYMDTYSSDRRTGLWFLSAEGWQECPVELAGTLCGPLSSPLCHGLEQAVRTLTVQG